MAREHYTLIIPIGKMAAANAWIEANFPGVGTNNFSVRLSANGAEPATHTWCGWYLSVARAASLKQRLNNTSVVWSGGKTSDKDSNTVLAEAGLQRIEPDI